MASLMILNPKPARAKKKAAPKKKHRRKMTAAQLKFFGPRKKSKRAKVVIVSENPRGKSNMAKKRRKHRRKATKFLSNPKRRNFRRNPRLPGASMIRNTLVPAAIGAAGALATDIVLGALPLPAVLTTGAMAPVTRIGTAMLIGMGAGAVAGTEVGEEVAAGGVVVALYSLARGFVFQNFPSIPMSRYVPMKGLQRYVPMAGGPQPPAMMNRPAMPARGLGYTGPARTVPNKPQMPSRGAMRFASTR